MSFISIPVTPGSAEARPQSGPTPRLLGEPGAELATVLLVEDDGHCRGGLRRQLVRAGFEVCEAANGLEALYLLNRRRVDVLATDIRMPTMSGIALIDALCKDHPYVPVVAYSGASLVDREIDARLQAARIPLLHKPFTPETLVAALREAMRRAAAARG